MFLLDPFSGISGDMFIAAMIDFVDREEMIKTIKKVIDVEIEVKKVKKCHILVNKINIIPKKESYNIKTYKDIKNLIKTSDIPKNIKLSSLEILKILAGAESKVHDVDIEKVHFHEVGNYDTVVDVIGASYIINKLQLKDNCLYKPINLGGGFVKTKHGIMPVPAPATAEILKDLKTFFSDVNEELTTPTGASILKYINPKLVNGRSMVIKNVSYGAGDKDLEILNALRVFKVENIGLKRVFVLESNVDDVPGEILGHLQDVLKEKVRDLHFIPTYMKKNRPAYTIKAIVDEDKVNEVAKSIMRETGSLGVRIYDVERIVSERSFETIKLFDEDVKIKIGKVGGEIISKKPEFEDLKRISEKYSIPIKKLYELVFSKDDEI